MKIGIVGLGLIGGSIALAAKQRGWHVAAFDECSDTLQAAAQQGAIDDAAAACADVAAAEVVVIAAPVLAAESVLAELAPALAADAVVTDTGSVKQEIKAAAAKQLKNKSSRFVGAHPIAGRENSGFAAADADLFNARPVLICADDSDADAADKTEEFWRALGGTPHRMDAKTHDEVFAHVSHLPHVLSYALVAAVDSHPQREELLSYVGGGFRDFVRIAGSHPRMWRDICLANRAPLADAIGNYRQQLETLEQQIQDGDGDALFALFDACRQLRRQRLPADNGETS